MFSDGSAPGVSPLTFNDPPPSYAEISTTIIDEKIAATGAEVDQQPSIPYTFTQPATIVRT